MRGANDLPLVPAPIDSHTSCLLMKIGQVVFRVAEDALAAHGLRIRHYSILSLLSAGASTQQDLVLELRIDAATMVTTLDDLERRGLVRRSRAEHDRRRYVVVLTAAGRKLVTDVEVLIDEMDARLLGELSTAAQAGLRKTLQTLSGSPVLTAEFDALRA